MFDFEELSCGKRKVIGNPITLKSQATYGWIDNLSLRYIVY